MCTKTKGFHSTSHSYVSLLKITLDKVDRFTLEEKRLAINIVEYQKAIEEAVNSDDVTQSVKLIPNERLIYNFED